MFGLGIMTRQFAKALGLLSLIWLAGCGGPNSFSETISSGNRAQIPPIGLVAMQGLPDAEAAQFRQALVNAFARRGMRLGIGNFGGGLELSGNMGSLPSAAGHEISYDWRLVISETGAEVQRVSGVEVGPGEGAFPRILMVRIAEATAETFASRFLQAGYVVGSAGMLPPPDAFAKAGPGAEKDIDYETLLGPGMQPPSLAPDGVLAESPEPEKPAQPVDDKAVAIRAIYLPAIAGDKTGELHASLKQVLIAGGWPVLSAARADALKIEGKMTIAPPKGASQLVSLDWVVSRPDGVEAGRVNQANQVPAGSLDQGWGETAQYAAEAAAEGMAKLVQSMR